MSGLPKETISIKNFGGMDDVTIDLAPINLFIGPQGTGKSVCAKLIYFCRVSLPRVISEAIFSFSGSTYPIEDIAKNVVSLFREFFPPDVWPADDFEIRYQIVDLVIAITYRDASLHAEILHPKIVEASRFFTKSVTTLKPKSRISTGATRVFSYFDYLMDRDTRKFVWNQQYVASERAYFSAIETSVYLLLNRKAPLDPFLLLWGEYFEHLRYDEPRQTLNQGQLEIEKLFRGIAGARHVYEDGKSVLYHDDGRRIPLERASSGQQNATAIGIVLKSLVGNDSPRAVFIEEPELSLYPNSQKIVIESIAFVFNSCAGSMQFIITTHSPYVLSVFNNLLQAGESSVRLPREYRASVDELVRPEIQLKPGTVQAFHFEGGKATPLVDDETGLIGAERLDQLSEDLSVQFDGLLELQWQARNSAIAKSP